MIIALAYALITVPISTLVVRRGVPLGMAIIAIYLFWIPDPQGSWIRGFLVGLAGELVGFGYGYLMFLALVGPDSFTIVPVCVAAIPLLFPPINDLRHARKVAAAGAGTSDFKETKATVWAKWGVAVGEAVGIPVGIVVFGVPL